MQCYQEHSFSTDRQKKLMKQIQLINKRLQSTNITTSKTLSKHQSGQQNSKGSHYQKNKHKINQSQSNQYFSLKCDDLFDVDTKKNKKTYEQSLFNSTDKNDLLIDQQFQKEIKNFKAFQTNQQMDKYESKNTKLFSKNSKEIAKSFQSQKINNNHHVKSYTQNEKCSNSTTKNSISSKKKNQSTIKSIAQSKIKRYIENKQNIFPSSYQQSKTIPKKILKQINEKVRQDLGHNKMGNYCLLNDTNQQYQQQYQQKQQQKYQQKYVQKQKQKYYQDSLEQISFFNKNHKNLSCLYGQKTEKNYDSHKQIDKFSLECTFKPNILKKSYQIAQNMQPSFERLTQDINGKSQTKLPYKAKDQLASKTYSVKRLQQLSQPRRLKTTIQNDQQRQKPTFRPSLSKKSLQQMANCTLNVAQRNKMWLQQKQAKINRLKIEDQQEKIRKQTSTFVPKINNYKGQSEVQMSRFNKQGMVNYFQRVSMAKQRNSIYQQKKPINNDRHRQSHQNSTSMKVKKKTYQQAVKQLHSKIMKMNI